ncbi:xanthine dehydrogenase family protein molybdopterin-binding subunit [Hahella ganghwensis]|uniref:xanthine dehydrogenase family protein molybdopterin-binding subunit n=1 Tax=Hahella ganghwensis TaxID=286420 RepID=UPI000376ABCE|nr:xanthine dehydrogenase family protein molybdopterin-binding subunit [Hahella ganghwensis]
MTVIQKDKVSMNRRDFFKVTTSAAGGLMVAMHLPGCASVPEGSTEDSLRPNAWLEVTPDSRVILTLDRVEMGQGTYTGMCTLLAEELDVMPESIEVVFAPVDDAYKHPEYGFQMTGGSSSIRVTGPLVRQAGAVGRLMLVTAAAQVWEVSQTQITTNEGRCELASQSLSLTYGELAELAARQKVPENVPLKPADQFKYIGKHNKRLDAKAKSFGTADFGIDTQLPGMVYAVISRPPVVGGKVSTFDASAALDAPGVINVIEVPRGVAIIAEQYWQARQAQEKLKVTYAAGEAGTPSDADVFALYAKALEEGGSVVREEGDVARVISEASRTIKAEYRVPFLAHAPMEPMNCTAWVRDGRCDVYTSTQVPDIARAVARRESGLSDDQIHIHSTFIGGGFGRRLTQEFVAEAVSIAVHLDQPVKLIWSREEDTQHGVFRPSALHRLTAAVDDDNQILAWKHEIACPRILDYYAKDAAGAIVPGWAPNFMVKMGAKLAVMTTPDHSPTEGAAEVPYAIPNIEVSHAQADGGIPVTFWRSVGHSHTAFAVESFVDELARQLDEDEVSMRLRLLSEHPRAAAVLKATADRIGWDRPPSQGVFRGVAVHESFQTYAAQIVELSVDNDQIKVHKVVCAVNCGQVVNPDMVEAQVESAIIFGLSAALFGKISFQDGQVQQSNFHDYRVLRMNETPEIDVIIIPSNEPSTGIGEPGVPPVAPAIANAVYKATGQRLRELPLVLG